jgi:hypothetical protein
LQAVSRRASVFGPLLIAASLSTVACGCAQTRTQTAHPAEAAGYVVYHAVIIGLAARGRFRRCKTRLTGADRDSDLKYALWMFCWWPGKTPPPPPPVRKQLIAFRRRFSTRGRPALSESARTAALDRLVSDAALTQDLDWLYQQQREGISYLEEAGGAGSAGAIGYPRPLEYVPLRPAEALGQIRAVSST